MNAMTLEKASDIISKLTDDLGGSRWLPYTLLSTADLLARLGANEADGSMLAWLGRIEAAVGNGGLPPRHPEGFQMIKTIGGIKRVGRYYLAQEVVNWLRADWPDQTAEKLR